MDPTVVIFLAATLVVLVAELIAGRHRGAYAKNELLVTGLCAALGFVTKPLSALLVAWVFGALLPQYRGVLSGAPFLPSAVGILLLSEYAFYWNHRLAHQSSTTRFNWYWKLHRTHHSGKFMNVLLNFRVIPVWLFVVPNTWIWGGAIYLGLAGPTALVILIASAWNLVTHSNFRWDDSLRRHPRIGPYWRALEHVVVTPGIHHTHHGYGRDGKSYCNYAVVLSLFDTLHGTLHIPEGRPSRYGLPGPNDAPWAEEVFFPLVVARAKGRQAS